MPNWCENRIIIIGSFEVILKLLNDKSDNKCLFEKLLELDIHSQNGFANRMNYGTKWDVPMNQVEYKILDNSLYLTFDTATSPPINFCKQLCKKWNIKITMEYYEINEDFSGILTIDEYGIIISKTDYTYWYGIYKLNKIEFWEAILFTLEDKGIIDTFEEYIKYYNLEKINQNDKNKLQSMLSPDIKSINK